MKSNFDLVKDFMDACDQPCHTEAFFPDEKTVDLRVKLIEEELQELKDAITDRNIVEVADALTDLLYVIYGAGHTFGINLDDCFVEVHSSNMTKVDKETGKVIKNEHGKVMKPAGYVRPDLSAIVLGE